MLKQLHAIRMIEKIRRITDASVYSNFFRVFEKLINHQLSRYMEPKFSRFLTGSRKHQNTPQSLLRMIANWKTNDNSSKNSLINFISNKTKLGCVIMDLSKAFDTINRHI